MAWATALGSTGTILLVAVTGAAWMAGCSDSTTPTSTSNATSNTTPTPTAHPGLPWRLPRPEGPFSPSHLTTDGPGIDGNVITEVESCAGCHADAAAQWRASAHAFGSFNNPIYRIAVDRIRTEIGKEQSRFCGGCHDIALLVDGAMTADAEIGPTDFRGHGGITCRVCHGIAEARADGNGSYTLASSPIPIPKDGDAESVRKHKERMALPPLRTVSLCGSCHRAFLTPLTGNTAYLVGQDEIGQWSQSVFAGSLATRLDEPVEQKECRHCHMPPEEAPLGDAAAKDGTIASHRFLGAHTWLARMHGDDDQLRRAQERLRGVASIDVAAIVYQDGSRVLPADGAPVPPGEPLNLDVVVRNLGVGHRFPAGTLDAQDTWIELWIHDAAGRVVAEAGGQHEKTGDDPTAHRLRAVQVGDDGQPLLTRETHRFRSAVYNHTIPPRDAHVVRYELEAPPPFGAHPLPWKITAKLRHRSRNLQLQKLTCADRRTPRGAAFAAEVKKRTGAPLDPCVAQPVTDIATKVVYIGAGAENIALDEAPVPTWRRLYDHGLGWLHALQEEVDEARPSLERALAELPESSAYERAMVMSLFAQVAARQARTDEALAWLDKARALVPDHPALAHIRGEAFSAIWQWRDAVGPLRQAAFATPRDDQLWMHLAVAAGSAGDPKAALEAAAHALELQPRDPDCLRVQSLALDALHAPEDVRREAEEAYLWFRVPDEGPKVKAMCSKSVPGCANERVPVHTHAMRRR